MPVGADAVVLLSRGAYSSAPRRQMERLVASLQAAGRYPLVLAALVDQGAPSLPAALDQCAAAGAQRVLVLPVFLPGDANLQVWLAKVARRWQADHANHAMSVVLGTSLGDHPALDAAVADALQAIRDEPDVRQSPPAAWEHDPDGWSRLPFHTHHLLTCRGPRCTARGGDACWSRLRERLSAEGLLGKDDRVLTAATGCLYPCNQGPILVVYPDGIWYGNLTPERIDQIVAEHLVHGKPLVDHRVYPEPNPSSV